MKGQIIRIFSDIGKLAMSEAEFLRRKITGTPDGKYFTLALCGGSTPKILYTYFAEHYSDTIDWKKLKIFWGDERCVRPEHGDSNYRMTHESFLKKVSVPQENVFRIFGEANPAEEAKRYSAIIKNNVQCVNGIPSFDLVFLGIGEDGHTASLFPDQAGLFYSADLYVTTNHPETNQKRITVTGKIINNARCVVFMVTGDRKARIVSEIIRGTSNRKRLPAAMVAPVRGELIWMLDAAAARLLE